MVYKAFALSGCLADCYYTQGVCPGLGASALSGRVGAKIPARRLMEDFLLNKQIVHCNLFLYDVAMFVLLLFLSVSVPYLLLFSAQRYKKIPISADYPVRRSADLQSATSSLCSSTPGGNKRKKRGKQCCFPLFKCSGWKVGLEPTTFRTTI